MRLAAGKLVHVVDRGDPARRDIFVFVPASGEMVTGSGERILEHLDDATGAGKNTAAIDPIAFARCHVAVYTPSEIVRCLDGDTAAPARGITCHPPTLRKVGDKTVIEAIRPRAQQAGLRPGVPRLREDVPRGGDW